MLPHQERVVQEKKELDEKIKKLDLFMNTDTYKALDREERDRLVSQQYHMVGYSRALMGRIAAFN